MAYRTTFMALVAGAGAWLAIAFAPSAALAGGGAGCGCKPPPPPPPPHDCGCHHQPPGNNTSVNVKLNVVTNVNVVQQQSTRIDVRQQANVMGAFIGTQTQAQVTGGGGGAASFISPGAVTAVNLGVGGEEREAYEAERTKIEKVVIQAFCFDDKDVPHPASQVQPDREIAEGYEGEVYRCIAGAHMQVTIAPWREQVSFEGGQTLTCLKGEALWHSAGQGGGRLVCRPQIPARDCNERSLLRRFGAGIKILTIVTTEKYQAYRERSSGA
ncbi:MAG TPA: hypothetical protein VHS81_00055, partial [Caulobacteraceae bacterium]|nr:hypothetical protein [Caulobacteraceae bacterium]